MTERRAEYAFKTGDPMPRRWLKLIFRILHLEAGKAYTITIFLPKARDAEPVWTVQDLGYIENQR